MEQDKLIWAYLDDTLDSESRTQFENRLREDKSLKLAYQQQLVLHQNLSEALTQEAPSELATQVMSQISVMKKVAITKPTFNGLKYIFIPMLAVILSFLTWALISFTGTTELKLFSFIQNIKASNLSLGQSLSSASYEHLLPYSIVLIGLVILIWIDQVKANYLAITKI